MLCFGIVYLSDVFRSAPLRGPHAAPMWPNVFVFTAHTRAQVQPGGYYKHTQTQARRVQLQKFIHERFQFEIQDLLPPVMQSGTFLRHV